jgi:hypothetical protein
MQIRGPLIVHQLEKTIYLRHKIPRISIRTFEIHANALQQLFATTIDSAILPAV